MACLLERTARLLKLGGKGGSHDKTKKNQSLSVSCTILLLACHCRLKTRPYSLIGRMARLKYLGGMGGKP